MEDKKYIKTFESFINEKNMKKQWDDASKEER